METKGFVIGILIGVCFISAACTPDTELPISPTATHTPTSTSTPEPPTPTPTPTSTPTPTPIPPFRDDFDQALMDGWTWLEEADSGWDLDQSPGFLRVQVRVDTRQLLVRDAPPGDFEVSTHLLFLPYSNFQLAGIIIYQDEGHYLTIHRGMCEYIFEIPEACQGNAIYFNNFDRDLGTEERYYSVGPQFPTKTEEREDTYLRLTREDNIYTAYTSDDDENWMLIGTHEANLSPVYVGIITCCAQRYWTYADFDYFTVEGLP